MTWETWNKVRLSCCCSSLTFFSHKFTQRHTFPRSILPWNIPFQWKTASVTIFFSQLWLWPARPHGDPLGRAQCIYLGVQHPLKRWSCRLRIDSMVPSISAAKMRGGWFFFFLALFQYNARVFGEHLSALLSKTWGACTHEMILRSDISRTNTIPVEQNHETKLWRKLNKWVSEQWN